MTSSESPAVAAAVVAHDGRVLLVRRAVAEGALLWAFPGGKVEPGESPEQAAVREALEETDLVVEALRVLGVRVHPATGRRLVYVACRPVSGTAHAASPREVVEVVWADRVQLAELIPGGVYGLVQDYLGGVLR